MTAALEPSDPHHIGRYRLLRRLGEGGMGLVYLGASPGGRAVAIKVVRPELAGDPRFRARFRAEAEAARKVSGAFTSPVVDADPDGPVPWLATAYVNGLNLRDTVRRYGPMPEPVLRTLGAGLGEALIAIHQAGLLHRDLKPGNILLAKDGPRVIDFGISKAVDGPALTARGELLGSPGYMSPEQIRGTQLTPAGDVFAFGAVLAYAATGRPPYGVDAVRTIIHRTLHEPPDLDGVPESLVKMVAACLSTDPERRPPAHLLPRLLAAQPVAPGWLPDALGEELQQREDTLVMDLRAAARARTRRRLLIGGAAVAGLAVVGGGTAAALDSGDRGLKPPRFLWQATTSGEEVAPYATARAIVTADRMSKCRGFDAATGRQLWSADYEEADVLPTGIYALGGSGGPLVACDPYSHATRWSYQPPFTLTNLMIGAQSTDLVVLTDSKTMIIGIDPRTGRQVWLRQWPGSGDPFLNVSGIIGRTLIAGRIAENDFTMFGLHLLTGQDRWVEKSMRHALASGPSDLLFCNPARTTLEAVSPDTGLRVWTTDLPDAGDPTRNDELSLDVTVAGGIAYTGEPTVHALDVRDGRQLWKYTPASPGGQERSFLVSGEHAYILDNPQLVALDARTGRRRWSVNTPAARTAPLIAAGGLICTGVSGRTGAGLYGWAAETGKLIWNHPANAPDPNTQWTFDTRGRMLTALYGTTLLAFHLD
ncbi:protein kinase domain-containing protein [Actinoallomurus rhizosphaericola]|uniref:protein kinase domain-containing protein n=1 Tax=Actinoallomurus rhizosphaericola TaxID=2952536 RepID=UPI0020932DC6|nr:PQQ-binding-like beta-propeller repeat protein [Actinoallomurus rhizosphaericola]MCO5995688.1 PQQ-binding-like beta-propeller repeat protein [Actinoallomurus rhizosphaericola]